MKRTNALLLGIPMSKPINKRLQIALAICERVKFTKNTIYDKL